jgi:hypothetical protein
MDYSYPINSGRVLKHRRRKTADKREGIRWVDLSLLHINDNPLKPDQTTSLKYEGEDDQSFFASRANSAHLTIPKNRSIPSPFVDQPAHPLTPAFRLLAWAFVGLAPAGLGTLVLAPAAGLWALAMILTRPLIRADLKRVFVVWGIATLLLGIAIPMSMLVLAHFHFRGRFP